MDYAQIFFDIFLCYRWLYDHPRILCRDINPNNIIYHIIDGKVYGVLNDIDLPFPSENVKQGTSLQRSGAPPYMAIDLLAGDAQHLYPHGLESLSYTILLLCCKNNNPLE